ncbi:MAG: FG-GAP-like repeat-containing protein, partial [Bacteroidota bacterium]
NNFLQEGELITVSISQEARNNGGISIISPKVFSFRVASSGGGVGRYTIENIISQTANRVNEILPADLDKDGDMDLVASHTGSGALVWYQNDGSGNFTPFTIRENFGGISHLSGADFNQDGFPDIVAASENDQGLSLFLNSTNQNFQELAIANTLDNSSDIQVSDLNGDGFFDLLASSFNQDRVVWFPWNSQNVNFDSEITLADQLNGLSSIGLGDLDEDQDIDVVLAASNDDQVIWLENNGHGAFSQPIIISNQATGVSDLALGDMDGDGDNDIVYASNSGDQLALFRNEGNAVFRSASSITSPDGISDLELGDLDADGDLDVIYNSLSNDRLSWQANNGNGSFLPENNISTSANGLADIQVADLDGDGDLEIIAALASDNTLIWFRNDDNFLDAPSNLSLTIASNEQIDLQWQDNSTTEDFFEIQRSVNGDEFVSLSTVGADAQTFSDPGLSTDIEYCYRVRAVNASSSSDFTSIACDTILAMSAPAAPSDLTLFITTGNGIRINLNWTDNADNEQNFVLERSIDGSPFMALENTDIDFNTQDFVDLFYNSTPCRD